MDRVEIVEVGPRDGLQSIPTFVPTATKAELVRRLFEAGLHRQEVGSFVSPKHVPQMADIGDLLERLAPLRERGLRAMGLIPNMKGAQRAVDAGLHDLVYVISVTESHNQSNVRRSINDSLNDLRALHTAFEGLSLRVGLACSFNCPFEGHTPTRSVLSLIERLTSISNDFEVMLSDTTGMAVPRQVKALARECLADFPEVRAWGFHGHDTAGFGVANALAAYEAGITTIDSSVAGLGGCPFAPGATGNVATEDVVYAFERQGVRTGVDLDRLLDAASFAADLPDGALGGHIRIMPRRRVLESLAQA